MLTFLIPSAKEMIEDRPQEHHQPYPNLSLSIVEEMSQKTLEELQAIYHFKKEEAALKEYRRWQMIANQTASSYTALELYNGLMYRALKEQLTPQAKHYLSQTTFITTALYGIIPLTEAIQPHRLDFSNHVKIANSSLKTIWKTSYHQFLQNHSGNIIISLLSSEFETVFPSHEREKLVKVHFYEQDQTGKLKQHATISKKGRGYFLRAVASQNCQSLEDLKTITFQGYHYQESDQEKQLTYVRKI